LTFVGVRDFFVTIDHWAPGR